jgi:uncharacterized protein
MPPAPTLYFTDYANVVSSGTANQLNQKLADFERATSCQVVVAVFPKMESDSSIEDYTLRVSRSWKVGQKDQNNGIVLFVFVQDHKMFIQVGYGLEGALPDSLCKRIISNEIAPRFKQGDFDGGLQAGVTAILAATKGEYKGNGQTVADGRETNATYTFLKFLIFVIVVLWAIFYTVLRGQAGWIIGGMFSGSSSDGSSWSGGGGGFSGGGGSFGGGGAGGSW